jgi:hypothetical protein
VELLPSSEQSSVSDKEVIDITDEEGPLCEPQDLLQRKSSHLKSGTQSAYESSVSSQENSSQGCSDLPFGGRAAYF